VCSTGGTVLTGENRSTGRETCPCAQHKSSTGNFAVRSRGLIARATARPERERKGYQHGLQLKTQSVPRSEHCVWVIKNSQLMLYREIMAVCFEIHTKHINVLCGQNVELLNVKLAVHIVTTGL